MAGVESQRQSRIPGQRWSSASIIWSTVSAVTSNLRSALGNMFTKSAGSRTMMREADLAFDMIGISATGLRPSS
jgi:hypothetical protein